MSVVLLIPVLDRPHNVEPLLETIEFGGGHRALFLSSPGDTAEQAELDRCGAEWLEVPFAPEDGDYQRKINWGAARTMEDWVFTGADDLLFHERWFENAMAHVKNTTGVIGTNDLANPRVMEGKHSTHSLVRRTYIEKYGTVDEKGKVLHEGYAHEHCDDELVATARRRGAWVFAADSHVEHLHPHFRAVATDAIYGDFERRMRIGRRIWDQRRQKFGL